MNQTERQDQLARALADKYQVICPIRAGGMAEVYLARNRFLGSYFAVKVLSDSFSHDSNLIARFEHEGRMAASLSNHPNIVTIFDIGTANSLHYLIMQYVAGEDLATYIKREGRLSLSAAANVIAQLTEALSFAEIKGIVHRDIKPANMLLDETGRVKLVDFGISKVRDSLDGLTRPGESFGTPAYMSPEQINGKTCDIRSDLYSLGAVFFELLSGRPPFVEDSSTAVLIAHLNRTPPKLTELDPAVPEVCDRIVQKLLAKNPDERYQSAVELRNELVAYGASSGAGDLRPATRQDLLAAIDAANSVPLHDSKQITAQQEARPQVLNQPHGGSANGAHAAEVPREGASSVEAAPPFEQGRSRKGMGIMLGGVGALAVLIVSVALFYSRSHRPPTSQAVRAPGSSLSQTFVDSHGRMLLVPAGKFEFGSAADGTERSVDLPAYYIDETEVSNVQYRRFCEATGHTPPATKEYATEPNLPVSGISYSDAAAYAAWAGRRLPTEEEWEKAARGSDGRVFPWGNDTWSGTIPDKLLPVDSSALPRSPYGAYNMAGNVWEWTATPFIPSESDTKDMARLLNGNSFSNDWRIIKGGSFGPGSGKDFDTSKHRPLPIDARSPWIGFRCVRDASSG